MSTQPPRPTPPPPGGDGGLAIKEKVRLVVAVVFTVLFIAFVLANADSVRVGFVFFDSTVPLIWVLVVTALAGALIDRMLTARFRRKRKARAAAKGGRPQGSGGSSSA